MGTAGLITGVGRFQCTSSAMKKGPNDQIKCTIPSPHLMV